MEWKTFLVGNNIFYVITAIFVIVLATMSTIYYFASPKTKIVMGQALGVFGQSVLIFNILILIFDKFLQQIKEQKDNIAKLNDFTMNAVNNVFNKFYGDKEHLGELYDEIFKGIIINPDKPPTLTYHEENFLFILFQVIENVYRTYYISGADRNKFDTSQYDGWEHLILKIVSSPKVQLFYSQNQYLFSSLNFTEYMDRQYFKRVKQYVKIIPSSKKKQH